MIPVRNLYYLFLYAWDRFSEGRQIDVGSDTSPDLPNLLARVLVSGVRRQFRRGLDKGYVEVSTSSRFHGASFCCRTPSSGAVSRPADWSASSMSSASTHEPTAS